MPSTLNADNGAVSGSAGLKSTADSSGVLALQTNGTTAVTVDASQNTTLAGALTVNGNTTLGDASTDTILMTGAPSIGGAGLGMGMGFRNRIINGAMVIDQRNAGALVTGANGYMLDRWYFLRGASSSSPVFNVQQSTVAPPNYKNSFFVTVTTSGAPGANNYTEIYQAIEGLNIADLGWGTATAQAVTLSFWVRCSVTGTYGVGVSNGAPDRSYIASYTVNAANTWEQKSVTIPGDTSGTWLTTNGVGMYLNWDLGVGTVQSTTAGSWQAGNFVGLTGGTKLSNTNGATFYITGVQLEKGSTATSFDYRPYGTELALCQRYAIGYTTNQGLGAGMWYLSGYVIHQIEFPVQMRSAPTLTTNTAVGRFYITGNSVNSTAGNITINLASISGCEFFSTVSGGTAGQGTSTVVSSGLLIFSSEL
jgi:hypothetical protein